MSRAASALRPKKASKGETLSVRVDADGNNSNFFAELSTRCGIKASASKYGRLKIADRIISLSVRIARSMV